MEPNQSISAPQSRIYLVDALRGFALLGVILMHMLQHFGVPSGMRPEAPLFPAADGVIQWISQHIIMGKFINIFAFLFGLSFFIQMDRAAQKGVDFRRRFMWRMGVLLAIGLFGNSFFTADILPIYALFGVVMVFLFPLKNGLLMLIALLLLVGTPRIVQTNYTAMTRTEQVETAPQVRPAPSTGEVEKPSFYNSAKRNLTKGFLGKLTYQFGVNGRGYITLALFILGLVVGRLRFFETVGANRKRNLILFALFTLATLLVGAIPKEEVTFRMLMMGTELTPVMLASMALKDIHAVLFSGALALGFIALYQIRQVERWLRVVVPFGRMGLTNYTVQSVLGGTLFSLWGLGAIFGTWGVTEVFVLGLVIYACQIAFSHFWMKHFLYGPLEWFWRSATYLKVQLFKRERKEVAAPLHT